MPDGSATLTSSFTLTAAAGTQVLQGRASLASSFSVNATTPLIETSDPSAQQTPYSILVLQPGGGYDWAYADLQNVSIKSIGWELNGMGSMTFSLPTLDPKAAQLGPVPQREVQVWRGGQMIWWGVITRLRADGEKIEAQCTGLKWYFKKRFIGKADRTNYFTNESFENGLAGWTAGYANPVEGATGRNPLYVSTGVTAATSITGSRSAAMYTADDVYPQYGHAFGQQILWEATAKDGDLWTATAWGYIPEDDFRSYVGGLELGSNGGLAITRYSTVLYDNVTDVDNNFVGTFPRMIEQVMAPFNVDTPMNQWFRMEAALRVPLTGETEWVQVSMFGVRGTIYWDEVTLTRNERLGFYDIDQALAFKGLIEHAQDPAFGKSSFDIGTNCPLTGVIRYREYEHADHQLVSDALDEFPTLHMGMDYDIVTTPTTRTATTYHPRKGITHRNVVLELGRNINTFSVDYDGEETANSVVVMSIGEGSDREEGGWIDAESMGGLILEKVYNAFPGSPIRTLDDQARKGVDRFKNPVIVPSVSTYEGSGRMIGVVSTGDTITVRIKHGMIDIEDEYRIMAINLDPKTDVLTYTLNKAAYSF